MATKRDIKNADDLKAAITELEKRLEADQFKLKENYVQVKENLQPKRVIKNSFSYAAETPEIQRTLVNTAIGFILGYASKKATELLSEHQLDRTVENIVNHHINELENRQPGSLLSKGISLFRKHTPPSSPIYPLIKYRSTENY
jgi:predicted nuclease with TOPRIM domain